jgi:hypothetical protein
VTPEPSESGVLDAGTRILRAANGSEVTLGELGRTGERPLAWSLDERRRLIARPITPSGLGRPGGGFRAAARIEERAGGNCQQSVHDTPRMERTYPARTRWAAGHSAPSTRTRSHRADGSMTRWYFWRTCRHARLLSCPAGRFPLRGGSCRVRGVDSSATHHRPLRHGRGLHSTADR